MEFPVDISFKLLSWYARVHVTDGQGKLMGFVPPLRKGLLHVPVYSDESMRTPIYFIKAEHMFTHWFEDTKGRRIGEFGITAAGGMGGGKFIFVGAKPVFEFVRPFGWAEFWEGLVPNLPVLNALTGPFVKLRTHAVRTAGNAQVLRIVKERLMFDVRYRLSTLEQLTDRELECLMLSALVFAYMDFSYRQ